APRPCFVGFHAHITERLAEHEASQANLSEVLWIGKHCLENVASLGDEPGSEVHKAVIAATTIDLVNSTPQIKTIRFLVNCDVVLLEGHDLHRFQGHESFDQDGGVLVGVVIRWTRLLDRLPERVKVHCVHLHLQPTAKPLLRQALPWPRHWSTS